jgi:ferritin-like metal-binding protein YciE
MVIKDDSLEKELMQEVRKIILESLKDSYVIEYTQGNIRSLEEVFEIKQKQVKELQGLVRKLTDENNKLMQQIKELREKIDAYKNIIRILIGNDN